MSLKKKGSAFIGTAVAAIAVTAMAAFACTNLATLNLSNASGGVGDTVTVTGSSFAVAKGAAIAQPVSLNWNGADGPVLAQATPDAAGNISATFTVPEGQPGYYVLVASQKTDEGVDAYGTPARASFQIFGPNGQSVVQAPPSQAPAVSNPDSSGMIALTIGLGALGLALFGAGFTAFVRQARRRDVPVASKVRSDS